MNIGGKWVNAGSVSHAHPSGILPHVELTCILWVLSIHTQLLIARTNHMLSFFRVCIESSFFLFPACLANFHTSFSSQLKTLFFKWPSSTLRIWFPQIVLPLNCFFMTLIIIRLKYIFLHGVKSISNMYVHCLCNICTSMTRTLPGPSRCLINTCWMDKKDIQWEGSVSFNGAYT